MNPPAVPTPPAVPHGTDGSGPDRIGAATTGEEPQEQLYKENILDHYKHPHNKRAIGSPTAVRRGHNPLCGDDITVSLTVEDGKISDVAFQGSGCAISQAAMSMLTEELRGKTLDEALAMRTDDIVAMLGIPIGPVRMKCAMLGLRTAQEAIAETSSSDKTA